MTQIARGSFLWAALMLAGLALGAYVVAAWPDTSSQVTRLPYGEAMPKTPVASPRIVRRTASVEEAAFPESELAGVAGAVYPGALFVYEPGPTPLLDALTGAQQPVDVAQ